MQKTLLEKVQNPQDRQLLSFQELEDFFYDLNAQVYEPVFQYAATLTPVSELVGFFSLSNNCVCVCDFCAARDKADLERFQVSQEDLEKLLCDSVKLPARELLVESGVWPKTSLDHLYALRDVLEKSARRVYYDLGIGTLLSVNSLQAFQYVFLDYCPQNPLLRQSLNMPCEPSARDALLCDCAVPYVNFLVDLPGQDFSDICADLFVLWRNPAVQGVKICPFIPQKNSRFARFEKACFLTTLKIIALSRIFRADWNIFVAPEILDLDYADTLLKSLRYGANKAVLPVLKWAEYAQLWRDVAG